MIAGIISTYLARRLIFASFVATVVMTGPVILISLFAQLPNEAVFSKLAWPALVSIASNILYHTVPALVSAAIVWCYAEYSSDGTLVTMHMAGLSTRSVRAPALGVAIGAMMFAYAMSCFVFPHSAGYLHDVINSLQHDMNPALLRSSSLNEIDGGRQVIFFRNWVDQDEIADVFIREISPASEEKTYVAKHAIFLRQTEKKGLALLNGAVQVFSPGKAEVQSAEFDMLILPVTEYGESGVKRRWTGLQELGLLSFLRAGERAFEDPTERNKWVREAVKRFGIPALALIHTLLGLELLALWGTVTGRRNQPVVLICGIIQAWHFAVVLAAEQAVVSVYFAWAAIVLIGAELALAIRLMTESRNKSPLVPMEPPAAWPDARAAPFAALPTLPPPVPAKNVHPSIAVGSTVQPPDRWPRYPAPASFST
jgi:lipopolysaccharide export system permease protein